MNYRQMADEYYSSMNAIKQKLDRYKKLLASGEVTNLEAMNAKVNGYQNIYYDLKLYATILEEKARKVEAIK